MKVVVFWEELFPCVDTYLHTRDQIEAGCPDAEVLFAGREEIATALARQPDVFVNPYGSAFPKAAWAAFTDYLKRGGSWINIGGSPLSRPVRRENGHWKLECDQTAYSKELRINQAFPVEFENLRWEWNEREFVVPASASVPSMSRAWSLQVRFSETKEYADECGSTSVRLAGMRRLLSGFSNGDPINRLLVAPVVAIDRFIGDYAGGRWVLVNAELEESLNAVCLAALFDHAASGAIEFRVRPVVACLLPGEQQSFNVYVNAQRLRGKAQVKIYRSTCLIGSFDVELTGMTVNLSISLAEMCGGHDLVENWADESGYQSFEWEFSLPDGHEACRVSTGFWRYDEDLFTSGSPLSVDKDYFWRDGKPFPVTGTTYMAGDVHRKFLFEPNPAVWDQDFAAMKDVGVNMVRTGIWTAWSRIMQDPGAVDEAAIRALMAFFLTARKYDIPVIFTFFAFLPPVWGGENPYLDPQCIAAQKAFVSAFAQRFKVCNTLLWDFINEPSFSSKTHEWYTRPNYDRFEQSAWREWLLAQASEDEWRERWRLTPNDDLTLPAIQDFEDKQIYQGTHPFKAMTYRLFAQEMFRRWTEEMASVIRANGNPNQLITVGQDEGGTGERPAPHFYGSAVDFTSNHSWWQNDDLLWDSAFTKLPDKPNLIEETGIMFVEAADGNYWRSSEVARNLLEHKMALAYAGGCAGFIQWLWNTNIYMDSDNEVGIGFHRADGSEKPELEAFRGIATFIRENAYRMTGRKLEDVVVIIPHSNLFSARNFADQATRRAVGVLEGELGVAVRCVSEYRMDQLGAPKLIILPCARNLSDQCWQGLLDKVEHGCMLFVTGFIESDEYWRPLNRLKRFGINTTPVPVSVKEPSNTDEESQSWCTFSIDGWLRADKAVGLGQASLHEVVPHGQGELLLYALPAELSSDIDMGAIYGYCLDRAGIARQDSSGISGLPAARLVRFGDCSLWIWCNESSVPVTGKVGNGPCDIAVAPGRIALAFINDETQEVLAKYKA